MKNREIAAQSFLKRVNDDSGTVESSLVMIPLVLLFLITLQLIATLNLRNVDLVSTQNEARIKAIQRNLTTDDRLLELKSGDMFERFRLLIINKEREIPQIFPGIIRMLGGKKLRSSGVSVYEEAESCSGGYAFC